MILRSAVTLIWQCVYCWYECMRCSSVLKHYIHLLAIILPHHQFHSLCQQHNHCQLNIDVFKTLILPRHTLTPLQCQCHCCAESGPPFSLTLSIFICMYKLLSLSVACRSPYLDQTVTPAGSMDHQKGFSFFNNAVKLRKQL